MKKLKNNGYHTFVYDKPSKKLYARLHLSISLYPSTSATYTHFIPTGINRNRSSKENIQSSNVFLLFLFVYEDNRIKLRYARVLKSELHKQLSKHTNATENETSYDLE
ncbi:hypothetical protein ACJW30_12G153700 [Castanea mollissima]